MFLFLFFGDLTVNQSEKAVLRLGKSITRTYRDRYKTKLYYIGGLWIPSRRMGQLRFQQLRTPHSSCNLIPMASFSRPIKIPTLPVPHPISYTRRLTRPNKALHSHPLSSAARSHIVCKMNGSGKRSPPRSSYHTYFGFAHRLILSQRFLF